jgi:hypothetical protein
LKSYSLIRELVNARGGNDPEESHRVESGDGFPVRTEIAVLDPAGETISARAEADALKCDGFLAKTLLYIPSVTICRQGKESSASSMICRRKIAQSKRRKKWD